MPRRARRREPLPGAPKFRSPHPEPQTDHFRDREGGAGAAREEAEVVERPHLSAGRGVPGSPVPTATLTPAPPVSPTLEPFPVTSSAPSPRFLSSFQILTGLYPKGGSFPGLSPNFFFLRMKVCSRLPKPLLGALPFFLPLSISPGMLHLLPCLCLFVEFIDFRERNVDALFHLFMHSLVASCMCSDQSSKGGLGVLGQYSNQLSYRPGLHPSHPSAWPLTNDLLLCSSELCLEVHIRRAAYL